ncbi:MAG: DNA polymerase III subunit delta' [Polyangiaceae bacterium]
MPPGPDSRGLAAVLGQEGAVGTLRRALASRHVAHAYRFEGPPGVGKEMAALALAQALVCERPQVDTLEGCGECHGCTRVVKLTEAEPHVPLHPDVVLLQRGLYPAASIGRSTDEQRDISVDQIRSLVLSRIAFPPHEGRGRVFIIREADEMSIAAANALLKTLEEPPANTHFVLLTSRGGELLDTIRSRTQLVRFAPLSDAILKHILDHNGVTPDRADAAVAIANGSASAALHAADEEASKARDAFVAAVLSAIDAPDLSPAIALAKEQEKDRDELAARFAALASKLAADARVAVQADDPRASVLAARFDEVQRAMREVERNASIGLVIESLIHRLRSAV